jgi:excisionase family DNA binding protein
MNRKIPLLTTKEAAEFLRVSEASMRRWAEAGTLKSYFVGNRGERRFNLEDLLAYLKRNRPKAKARRSPRPRT